MTSGDLVNVVALQAKSVKLTWSITLAPGDKVKNFSISCPLFSTISNITANTRSYTVSVMSPSTAVSLITVTMYTTLYPDGVGGYVTVRSSLPPVASAPLITSPTAGTQFFTNANINVSWKYNGPSYVPQAGVEISSSADNGATYKTHLKQAGTATTATLPAGTFTTNATRLLRIRTYDKFGQYSPYSSTVLITTKKTVPDTPVPTKPADNASAYPNAAIDFAYNYAANGGYALKQTLFRWRLKGSSTWEQRTYNSSTPAFTIPKNTFALGTYQWGIAAVNVNNEQSSWSATRTLNIASPVPSAPVLTAPSAGSQIFINSNLTISWQYKGPEGIAQNGADIETSTNNSTYTQALKVSGAATSGTIPAWTYALDAGTQNRWFRVRTYDQFGQVSPYSTPVMVVYKSVTPDKPVPTTPVNNSTSYPRMPLTISFAYAANGGYGLKEVVFRRRLSGASTWTETKYAATSPSITIPAGTLALGTYQWQIRAINTNNNQSEWSDIRTLYIASSAPLAPTLIAPANDEKRYNNNAVVFTWQYNINADVKQGRYDLQWRLAGSTNWTTISRVSSATQHTVEAGALSLGTIQWRMRTANDLGEWSTYSTIYSFIYAYPAPETPEILEPVGGYVDRYQPLVMTWTYASPVSSGIAAARVSYRRAGGSWTYISLGAVLAYEIPAETLPLGEVELSVQVTDAAGRVSAWATTRTISTDEPAPLSPTPIEPVDIYLPVSSMIRFAWTHNSPVGAAQAKADIRYRQNTETWTTATITGATNTYLLSAFTFMPGNFTWQVRTYNREGDVSPWSNVINAGITGAPVTPIITQISGTGARITVHWTAPGQISWEVHLVTELGETIYTKGGMAEGDNTVHAIPVFLDPGVYSIQVRTKNQYNFWSEYAYAAKQIDYQRPDAPVIGAKPVADAVEVSIGRVDFGTQRAIVFRDGIPIAMAEGSVYLDETVGSMTEYVYFVRVINPDGAYADSDPVAITVTLSASWIMPSKTASEGTQILVNVNGPPARAAEHEIPVKITVVEGREYPVADYSPRKQEVYTAKYAVDTDHQLKLLYDIKAMRTPVLYRDTYGRRNWCAITATDEDDVSRIVGAHNVSIVLEAIDYDESITIP